MHLIAAVLNLLSSILGGAGMTHERSNPQINVSKIPGDGGIAGALFAIGSMLILVIGIPRLRIFLAAAIILGCGVALILRFARRESPGKPWILADTPATDSASSPAQASDKPQENIRHKLQVLSPA